MLLELQKILQCGKIYLDNENYSCRFYIRNLSIINQLIIPIFQEFPLNTSKQLNFIDFSNVAKMLTNKLHLTDEGLTQILNIKSQMNNNREDLSKLAYRPIKITWPWLLGFLEGDGSFSVSGTLPRFFIDATISETNVLIEIKNFLNCGNVHSRTQSKSRPNQKPTSSFSINSIEILYNFLIVNLDNLTFMTKKYKDFLDWKLIVKLNYLGYHP